VGLGLGFLGSSLALPFGVFVLICQRNPEKNLQVFLFPSLHIYLISSRAILQIGDSTAH
jgi:hypothetical protein